MKYLALLDCSLSKVRIIKLDEDDMDVLAQSADALTFIYAAERKYDFKESQCSWMLMDELNLSVE